MTATPVQTRFEVAPGVDRAGDPALWSWQEEDRLARSPVPIKVGRDDEEGETAPSNTTLLLKNKDGRWTPRNPTSGLYPYVDAGMPARVVTLAGRPHLTLSGATGAASAKASTPNDASLQITSDLSGVVELAPFWSPGFGLVHEVAGRYVTAGNQRSWILGLWNDHTIDFRWSPDGIALLSASSTVPLPRPDTMSALGWWINVADGANRIITFYWAYTRDEILADPAGHILDQVTQVGNTSIHAGTADLVLGDIGPFRPFPGMLRSFQLRSGDLSTGTIVANPDFTLAEGLTALTDSAGRAWTFPALDRRHIRLSGTTGAVRPTWPMDGVTAAARARVPISGPLRRLGQGDKPLHSALRRLITSPSNRPAVKAYWPWEDERDAVGVASPIAGVAPMSSGGMVFSSSADLDGSKPLATVSAGEGGAWVGVVPAYTSTSWSLDWFVDLPTPETAPTVTNLQEVNTTGTVRRWLIQVNDTSVSISGIDSLSASVVSSSFAWDARFAVPSLLRLEVVQNGGNVDWDMRWVPIYGTGAGLAFGIGGSYAGTTGVATRVANLIVSGPPDGLTVGHMVIADQKNLGWLAPADSAYVGERAATRFRRLCDEEGIPVTIVGDPDESEPTGPQRALSLPDLLRECRDVDLGLMGEQRYLDGLLYRTRASLQNQPTRLTITKPRNPFEPTADDSHLRNHIEVQRPTGSSYPAIDQASIDSKGLYDDSLSVNVELDSQLPDQAGWRLHLGTWPEMRYGSLTAGFRGMPDSYLDTWLFFGLGDRLVMPDPPTGHPPEPIDQIAQGWTETLSSFDWEAEISCSPAGPWTVGVIGDETAIDTDLPRLATDGSTLAAGIDDNDLSWTVTTTDPDMPLWITTATDPDHFPLLIEIGGEQITISGISGVSSPQTFTASARSVNGVAKSHSSGAAVQVADPIVLAF